MVEVPAWRSWVLLATTALFGVFHVLFGVLYLVPEWSQVQYRTIGRVSLVSYIGPAWSPFFFLTAGLLIGAVAAQVMPRKWVRWLLPSTAHALGGALMVGFTAALFFGAQASQPHGPYIAASLASLPCFLHVLLSYVYVRWGR